MVFENSSNYSWYYCLFHVSQLSGKIQIFLFHFLFWLINKSIYFYSVVFCNNKIYKLTGSFLLVDEYNISFSSRERMIRWYLKIPENFMGLIF